MKFLSASAVARFISCFLPFPQTNFLFMVRKEYVNQMSSAGSGENEPDLLPAKKA